MWLSFNDWLLQIKESFESGKEGLAPAFAILRLASRHALGVTLLSVQQRGERKIIAESSRRESEMSDSAEKKEGLPQRPLSETLRGKNDVSSRE